MGQVTGDGFVITRILERQGSRGQTGGWMVRFDVFGQFQPLAQGILLVLQCLSIIISMGGEIHSLRRPIEAILPRCMTDVLRISISGVQSSLSSSWISESKFTRSGSITPLSLVGLVRNSSVNRLSFVSVPSVRPKAEKDLQKDRFFLCWSFCSSILSWVSRVVLILFSTCLAFQSSPLIIFSASRLVTSLLVLSLTSLSIFSCFSLIFSASILSPSSPLFIFFLMGLSFSTSSSLFFSTNSFRSQAKSSSIFFLKYRYLQLLIDSQYYTPCVQRVSSEQITSCLGSSESLNSISLSRRRWAKSVGSYNLQWFRMGIIVGMQLAGVVASIV